MRLLLSVISKDEALGIESFADVIDIKDPSKGALGAPNPEIVKDVRNAIGATAIISVALGEAVPGYEAMALEAMAMAKMGATIVKIALADISNLNPVDAISYVRGKLPLKVKLVACAYADGGERGFMPPSELPYVATLSGADGILIDTFNKIEGSLFDSITASQLENIVKKSKKLGLMTALAGSLDVTHIEKLALVAPDYIGFRSAITIGKNRGSHGVDEEKAMLLKEKLSSIKAESVSKF